MSTVASLTNYDHLQQLQKRLGHQFANPQLLQQALTHCSYSKTAQQKFKESPVNNELLEFLGDAVLSLVVAHDLYTRYPHAKEGALSRLRSHFVCQSNLYQSAQKLELNRWIRASKAVYSSGVLHQPSILSDTLEAVLAAVYLDAGLPAAQQVIHHLLKTDQATTELSFSKDPKTQLQEELQKTLASTPCYHVVDTQGPQHAPCFTVAVMINKKTLAQGEGSSKQKAQQQAAVRALKKLQQLNQQQLDCLVDSSSNKRQKKESME